jgi:hypothetical protein
MVIDTTFDFRSDAGGKDPDSHSPTLRRYHQQLWSKRLPNGQLFELSTSTPGAYLYHRSNLGEFSLTSDSAIPSYRSWKSMEEITKLVPSGVIDDFQAAIYTIGGMMIFPGNLIDGKMNINGARGFTPAIADRMDLTLECIRRHYQGEASPLAATLQRYGDFFELFSDFEGYVDFFLLNDLVDEHYSVRFFMDFDDFRPPSKPSDLATYEEYRRRSLEFIVARNGRIHDLSS